MTDCLRRFGLKEHSGNEALILCYSLLSLKLEGKDFFVNE